MEVKASANVSVIPATKRSVRSGAVLKTVKNLRVAAYCRVSTGNDEQQSSYIKQKEYYTKLISFKEGWQMAGIYADEAITVTSRIHRKGFKQQLLTRRINLYNIYDLNLSLFTKNCTDVLETSLFKSQKMRLYITVSVEYSCFLLYNINVMTTLRSQRVKRDRYGKNCLQKGR